MRVSRTALFAIGGAALSAVLAAVLIALQGPSWGSEFVGITFLLVALLVVIFIQAFEISRKVEAVPGDFFNRQRLHALLAAGTFVAGGAISVSIAGGPHGLIAPFGLFLQLLLTSIGRNRFAT